LGILTPAWEFYERIPWEFEKASAEALLSCVTTSGFVSLHLGFSEVVWVSEYFSVP